MKAKKKTGSLERRNARAGWLFCLPFLIGLVLFFIFPILQNINISFRTLTAGTKGMNMEWIGLENYYDIFNTDAWFMKDLVDSLQTIGINFLSILLFSFFIATILNQKFIGRGFARAMFFLPVVIGSGLVLVMQNNEMQSIAMDNITQAATSDTGVTQMSQIILELTKSIGNGSGLVEFVNEAVKRVYDIITSSGVQILIFLAGLQTISPSLFEASSMEGATAWENFWKITVPMISPLILVNAVYTIVDSMCGVNNVMVSRINWRFTNGNYGYAAAMGWVYFPLVIVLLGILILITRKMIYYEND